MSAGQSMLSIAAFILLTTVLQGFYASVGSIGDDVMSGQDGILATTIATSYIELANGMAFDEVTDSSNVAIGNPTLLTGPLHLGHEAGEDSLAAFNDFDDFNGYSVEKEVLGSHRKYRTSFTVSYVNPDNIVQYSSTQTFVKRLDLRTWRTYPVSEGAREDTLYMSVVMGYFHFD